MTEDRQADSGIDDGDDDDIVLPEPPRQEGKNEQRGNGGQRSGRTAGPQRRLPPRVRILEIRRRLNFERREALDTSTEYVDQLLAAAEAGVAVARSAGVSP